MKLKNKKLEKFLLLMIFIVTSGVFALHVIAENDHTNPDSIKVATGAVMINTQKQQLIGVKKYTVKKRNLIKTIRTVGRVKYDERLLKEVNLKVEGWVEKLNADFVGKYVRQGEPLFKLYSPELLNAQEEYLLATSGRTGSQLKSSARTKLLLWDITDAQIKQLDRTRKPATLIEIQAPISGYIISKSIIEGGHIAPGQTLFTIADIKKVWVLGDIYEFELPLIKLDQKVLITSQSLPGELYPGEISHIYPNLNPKTRSVKIRIEMNNPDEKFKPGMFTNIHIQVDQGMRLAVPESAVLQSGVRNIIFFSKGNGMFVPKEVEIGPLTNGFYPVQEGLAEGEVVVSSANFFLDSESKLMSSMEGMMGLIGMGDWKMEHSKMGDMDMSGMKGMTMSEGSDTKTGQPMNMESKTMGEPQ
jgi:Cu(I)/Ag(I) efflux system membrane fusion protein